MGRGNKCTTVDDIAFANANRDRARMTTEQMRRLYDLLVKYEENRFRRREAGLAELVSRVKQLVGEDVEALLEQSLSEAAKQSILQE